MLRIWLSKENFDPIFDWENTHFTLYICMIMEVREDFENSLHANYVYVNLQSQNTSIDIREEESRSD